MSVSQTNRPNLDKLNDDTCAPGEYYVVFREAHEYYSSSTNSELVQMIPISQLVREIYIEQALTYKRDHVHMKTVVISTYRSLPDHHNAQTGKTWFNRKAYIFTFITGIEDTPFRV
ncbi:hypothetical protein P9112_002377 [Eukaryota sp. TZLM1-RC]